MTEGDRKIIGDIINDKFKLINAEIGTTMTENNGVLNEGLRKTVRQTMAWVMVLLIFVMGGAFGYTTLLSFTVKEHHREAVKVHEEVDNLHNSMRTVSGTLFQENPKSMILRSMYEYYTKPRGNEVD